MRARAVVSFFSYRYFRNFTYYSVSVVAYESLVVRPSSPLPSLVSSGPDVPSIPQLAAFLMLLLQYIGESNEAQLRVLKDKEKRKIPFPFCCIRFRPSKPCASPLSRPPSLSRLF